MTKSRKEKKASKSKKRLLFVVFIFISATIIGLVALVLYKPDVITLPSGEKQIIRKKETSGDPQKITDYGHEAIKAWKQGDKEKAKELAQKALDENAKTSVKNQEKVPSQGWLITQLNSIAEGKTPSDI